MVTIELEQTVPANTSQPRKMYAFGFVKVRLGGQAASGNPQAGSAAAQPAEMSVLGLLVMDSQPDRPE